MYNLYVTMPSYDEEKWLNVPHTLRLHVFLDLFLVIYVPLCPADFLYGPISGWTSV